MFACERPGSVCSVTGGGGEALDVETVHGVVLVVVRPWTLCRFGVEVRGIIPTAVLPLRERVVESSDTPKPKTGPRPML